MNLATLVGLSGMSLLLSVILFSILGAFKINRPIAYLLCSLLFVLSFIPVDGYTINQYLRGLFNDLSISSMIVLGYYLINPEHSKKQLGPILVIIALTGIFFYPAAGGFGPLDPYAWGYLNQAHGLFQPLLFLTLLGLLMTVAFIMGYTTLLVSLVVATIAFQLGWLESKNLWDYLLDPLIFLFAFFSLISRGLARIWPRAKT